MKFLKLSFLLFFAGMINCSAQIARSVDFHNRYKLSKVVIMGRHHVRSAALTKGERRITPHEWHQWTVDDGNLSERGMRLEQLMGVYFRHWATNEQLLDFNSSISADSVFIYANSMSRTVETASNFAIGFFPSAQIEVNYNKEVDFGSMDPVFFDKDFKISDVFKAKVNAEVEYGCGEGGFAGAIQNLERDAQVLADVLDISSAPSCLNGDTCGFHFDNAKVYLHLNWMPRITGGNIYLAQLAAGNIILQYYDMPESEGSIFGHAITDEQLLSIGRIKDMWCHLSMAYPSVGRDICHNLLGKIRDEMTDESKKFTYLVGHDSNMAGLTGALEVKEYTLDGTPECKTPLGGKIVFEIWQDEEGEEYVALNYVYQSVRQILRMEPLDMSNPPMIKELAIDGLRQNNDGLYKKEDFLGHLNKAIAEFDILDEYRPYDVNLDRRVDMLDVVDILLAAKSTPYKFFVSSQSDVDGDGTITYKDAIELMRIIANNKR